MLVLNLFFHFVPRDEPAKFVCRKLPVLERSGRLNMSAAGESGDGVASARNVGAPALSDMTGESWIQGLSCTRHFSS